MAEPRWTDVRKDRSFVRGMLLLETLFLALVAMTVGLILGFAAHSAVAHWGFDMTAMYGEALDVGGVLARGVGAGDPLGAILVTRYLDYLKTRTYMVNIWRGKPYDDEARQAAKEAGLTLRDLPAEVMDDATAGLSEKWAPFPY